MSMCACVGYVCAQVDAAKKEAPGPVLKKEDKDAPTTAASKENDPNEDDKNAAIPSALSEDQNKRLISTDSSASLGPNGYRAMYCKTGLCLNSCAYFLGIKREYESQPTHTTIESHARQQSWHQRTHRREKTDCRFQRQRQA